MYHQCKLLHAFSILPACLTTQLVYLAHRIDALPLKTCRGADSLYCLCVLWAEGCPAVADRIAPVPHMA
jgi:hypothetical protein